MLTLAKDGTAGGDAHICGGSNIIFTLVDDVGDMVDRGGHFCGCLHW